MNKLLNNLIPPLFSLKIIIFLAHDEPTNWIPPSLKFPPSQPPNPNPNYPTFCFPPSDSPVINIPSSMNSHTNSVILVFHTISQFNNSDVETRDEFADSEPSPSTHTQTNSSVFFKTPLSTHPNQSSTPIPFYSFLRFPSNPNLFSI